jgi:pilus assembly protein CpaF
MKNEMKVKVIDLIKQHLKLVKPLLDDPATTEVMINNPSAIYVENAGVIQRVTGSIESDVLEMVITMLAAANGRPTPNLVLTLDARLPSLRLAAARGSVAIHGPCLSIRKHSALSRTLNDYLNAGSFDPVVQVKHPPALRPQDAQVANGREGLMQFLRWMVLSRQNFVVSGATSSGKTSFLNAILREMPESRRLFTIEDTSELVVPVPNFVSFEALEGSAADSRVLGKLALRMRPDSILHGEVRGREAYDLMDAYRTGHPGSGVSYHADSADNAPYRLETMIRMAEEGASLPLTELRRQISQTFQFFIHCEKVEGARMPVEVLEMVSGSVDGYVLKRVFVKKKEYLL